MRAWSAAAVGTLAAAGGGGVPAAASAAAAWRPGESLAWPRYPGRRVLVLNGSWDFAFLGNVGLEAAAAVREEDLCRKVPVPDAFDLREWLCEPEAPGRRPCAGAGEWPCRRCCDLDRGPEGAESCWQGGVHTFRKCCDPVALGRRGIAAYRTFLPADTTLLHFHACSMRCVVYVNRQWVTEHIGGYSPFWASLEDVVTRRAQELELLVLADNRFSPEWPVHQPYFDWYQAGGLLRAVEAHLVRRPRLYLRGVSVLPRRPVGTVTVEIRFSEGCLDRDVRVALAFDGAPPGPMRNVASEEELWWETVPRPRLWSPAAPELHLLSVSLWAAGEEVDRVTVRFGLRLVETSAHSILLNGEPLLLKGVNRHETHPLGGAALSPEQLLEDMALLQELGANFVRGSHYSQDQRWLDLCDERGILVWEETLGWQPTVEHLRDRAFLLQQFVALDETLNASASHPSVIMWGFLNEADTETEGARPAHKALSDYARQRDPTRLVSWGSRRKMDDVTLDLADVISFNDYPGWYDSSVDEIPAVWQKYADWARQHHPGKPLLISEVGADGLAGFRSTQLQSMWSEDLQASIVRASILAAKLAGFAGVALWQFTDSRVDSSFFRADNPQASPLPNVSDVDWVERVAVEYEATASPYGSHLTLRPRGLNSKGLVSLDRQHRKAAFAAAKEAFLGACLVVPPAGPGWPEPARLVAVGAGAAGAAGGLGLARACVGCSLSVHVWNPADRSTCCPGIRVHGHESEARASLWTLSPSGLLRLAGHADGRQLALGAFLVAAPGWPGPAAAATVEEAAGSLWAWEPSPGGFLLRAAFGPACGGYLSLRGEERDESSLYATVQQDRSLATTWRALAA